MCVLVCRAMSKCKEFVVAKQKSSVSDMLIDLLFVCMYTHNTHIHRVIVNFSIQAKHWLRQSKMYTKQVEAKESMYTNVQTLLTKIQMAETDAMVTVYTAYSQCMTWHNYVYLLNIIVI